MLAAHALRPRFRAPWVKNPSAAQSTVVAGSASIANDGVTSCTVTITVLDTLGNPVIGLVPVLAVSGSGNTVTQPGATSILGVAVGSFVSTTAETKTLSATANGIAITQTASCVVSASNDVASIVSLSPSSGTTAGGTPVTITVTGATGTPAVRFGGVSATSIVVVNSTTITCVTPAGTAGAQDLVVGSHTDAAAYTYTSSSEPLYNASIHTLVWPGQTNGGSGSSYSWDSSHPSGNARTREDFSGFASSAAILAYYANAQSGGSVNKDASTGVSSSISLRIDWTDQGCLGASDANVNIQKRLGKKSDGTNFDVQNYSPTAKHWVICAQVKFGSGYKFYGRASCARSGDEKIIVVYRDPNATHNKFTFHADNENGRGCPISAYSSYNGQGLWDWGWDSSESDGSSPACGSPIFPGVVNNGTLDPGNVGDNTWRRLTLEVRKESSPLAGDGLYRLWLAGTQKANYDGQDAGNVAYQKCYTGDATGFFDPGILYGIFNAGPPQAQSCWVTDWQVYYVTGS